MQRQELLCPSHRSLLFSQSDDHLATLTNDAKLTGMSECEECRARNQRLLSNRVIDSSSLYLSDMNSNFKRHLFFRPARALNGRSRKTQNINLAQTFIPQGFLRFFFQFDISRFPHFRRFPSSASASRPRHAPPQP